MCVKQLEPTASKEIAETTKDQATH